MNLHDFKNLQRQPIIDTDDALKLFMAISIFTEEKFDKDSFNFNNSNNKNLVATNAIKAIFETKKGLIQEILKIYKKTNKLEENVTEKNKINYINQMIKNGSLSKESIDFLKSLSPYEINAIYHGFITIDKDKSNKLYKKLKINKSSLNKSDCAILTEIIIKSKSKNNKNIKMEIENISRNNKDEELDIVNDILNIAASDTLKNIENNKHIDKLTKFYVEYNKNINQYIQPFQDKLTNDGYKWLSMHLASIEDNIAKITLNIIGKQPNNLNNLNSYMKSAMHVDTLLNKFKHINIQYKNKLEKHRELYIKHLSDMFDKKNNPKYKNEVEKNILQIYGSDEAFLKEYTRISRQSKFKIESVGMKKDPKTGIPFEFIVTMNDFYYRINLKSKKLSVDKDYAILKITEEEYEVIKNYLLENLELIHKQVFEKSIPELDKEIKKEYFPPEYDDFLKSFDIRFNDKMYHIFLKSKKLVVGYFGKPGRKMTFDEYSEAKKILLNELNDKDKAMFLKVVGELDAIMENA